MIKLDEYPKSKEKLLGFTRGWMEKLQQDLLKQVKLDPGEKVPIITDEMVIDAANHIINSNMRSLYLFFDTEKVFMVVDKNSNDWVYKIVDKTIYSNTTYKNREEAEVEGFKEAFKILENE